METLRRHIFEFIASVWLVIVAVQYVSSYYFTIPGVDFRLAYVLMLCLMFGIAGYRGFKAIQPYLNGRKIEAPVTVKSGSESSSKSRRHRR